MCPCNNFIKRHFNQYFVNNNNNNNNPNLNPDFENFVEKWA